MSKRLLLSFVASACLLALPARASGLDKISVAGDRIASWLGVDSVLGVRLTAAPAAEAGAQEAPAAVLRQIVRHDRRKGVAEMQRPVGAGSEAGDDHAPLISQALVESPLATGLTHFAANAPLAAIRKGRASVQI